MKNTSTPPETAQQAIDMLVRAYPLLTRQAQLLKEWQIPPDRALQRLIGYTESPSYAMLPSKAAPSNASMAYLRGPSAKPRH